jgi:hypothetical protein
MPFRIPMKTKKNCILYLVRSSQNDIDMLNKSLLLVSLNLIPAIKKKIDIIIFHEKSFDSNYQKKVEQPNECEVIFQEVNFILPDYDEEIKDQILTIYPHPSETSHPGFSMGYRYMCDFFSGSLYEQTLLKDYSYYLRLDTDSFIISKIKYDLFEWMEDKKCEYGFILPAVGRDHPKVVEGLWNQTSKYISENNIKTQKSINNIPDGQFYYTNFEIGKVSSFSEGSQYYKFYRFIRSTGNIFIKRWGDAPIKMLGVNLFINKKAIRPVHGFVYQHSMTYNLNRLQNNNLCIFMFKVIRRLKKLYKQQ